MGQQSGDVYLAGAVVILALGALEITALVATLRRALTVSALIGGVSGLLFAAAIGSTYGLISTAFLAAAGACTGIAGYFVMAGFIWLLSRLENRQGAAGQLGLVAFARDELAVPSISMPTAIENGQLIARRWFVVVGAVTGSFVFALMTFPEFHEGLRKTFSPGAVFAVAVAAVASAVLEGPFRQFVFGDLSGDQVAKPFPVESMDPRGWMRLGLIGLFFLSLALLFNALEESVTSAALDAAMSIVLIGVPAAIASWYWCAYLQAGECSPDLRRKSWRGAFMAGAVLYHPFGMILSVLFGLMLVSGAVSGEQMENPMSLLGGAMFIFGAPYIAILPATFMSFLTTGLPAWAGARVLESRSGWSAMVLLTVALFACTALPSLATVPFMDGESRGQQLASMFPYQFLIAAGWVIGLVATGFPGIVRQSKQLAR